MRHRRNESEDVLMEILNEISAQLKDVDEKTICTPLITEVLLKLENCTKTLQKQNKAASSVQIAENLAKLFEGFLLSTIEPTSAGLDFIRETIEFKKNLHSSYWTGKRPSPRC